jgi:hypothetical protein
MNLRAVFSIADDLLWEAEAQRLPSRGSITVQRAGRLGPVIEMGMARRRAPEAYASIRFDSPLIQMLDEALERGKIIGAGAGDAAGIFPLSQHDPEGADQSRCDQWFMRARNAAIESGIPRQLAAALCGAVIELQSNVYTHSGRSDTGIVAYGAMPGTIEFVVADAGKGVLASLRSNPRFDHIGNSGQALEAAATDGVSCLDEPGRGVGISQLFRALTRDYGEIRFRSGDHSLILEGNGPSLTGRFEIAQKAHLQGLVVSVRVRAPDATGKGA